MSVKTHEISVTAQGVTIPKWKSYTLTQDVLQPANEFTLEVQFSRRAWDALALDSQIEVYIDSTRILSGFVGGREKVPSLEGGTNLRITGRDKTGRLVDGAANRFRYGGLRIKELAERIVGDLFEDGVELVNTRNRSILRNVRARQARVAREPLVSALGGFRPLTGIAGIVAPPVTAGINAAAGVGTVVQRVSVIDPGIFTGRQVPKKVTPGSTKWQVLEEILSEARLMAWSSADGRKLFVGLPNYDQEIQYLFVEASSEAGPKDLSNAKISVIQNVEDMYSAYVAVGASKGNGANYGPAITKNTATVYDNPENPGPFVPGAVSGKNGAGLGINFLRPKVLVVQDDGIKNARDALERAEREKLEREASFWELEVEVAGHSQIYAGEEPTLYTVDTMAAVEDYDTGIGIDPGLPPFWYITQVTFELRAASETKTTLRLVPKGTLLVL